MNQHSDHELEHESRIDVFNLHGLLAVGGISTSDDIREPKARKDSPLG